MYAYMFGTSLMALQDIKTTIIIIIIIIIIITIIKLV
jgi:hypothetical protein